MIAKIAYRNIWRNRLRSLVVIIAIALGIWGGLLVTGLAAGLTKMRQDNAIGTYISDIQIHNRQYNQFARLEDTIQNFETIRADLAANDLIKAFTSRLKVESYLQSARGSSGVIINGIDPMNEARVTTIHNLLENGNYLDKYKSKPPVIVGKKLADKMQLGVKSTLQFTFLDIHGEAVTAAFKVVDIYKTGNSLYDEMNVFVPINVLQQFCGTAGIHEVAIIAKQESAILLLTDELSQKYNKLDVESWKTLAPELGYADDLMEEMMTLFLGIIMLALAFGIVNTMLMAVLERRKELGMLLAVGMNKKNVFKMIMYETLMLSALGAPTGIILALISQSILAQTGIDLSFLSQGLESVGLQSILYPRVEESQYIIITILVVVTSVLSAVYPARKALQLNPSETLRTAA